MVGSVANGKPQKIVTTGASFSNPQYTHPHPFFSPDLRYVLFNSDRTGIPQIYAAPLSEKVRASLGRS